MGTGKKIVIGMILFFVLAAAGIYGAGVFFFSMPFFSSSPIKGLEVFL